MTLTFDIGWPLTFLLEWALARTIACPPTVTSPTRPSLQIENPIECHNDLSWASIHRLLRYNVISHFWKRAAECTRVCKAWKKYRTRPMSRDSLPVVPGEPNTVGHPCAKMQHTQNAAGLAAASSVNDWSAPVLRTLSVSLLYKFNRIHPRPTLVRALCVLRLQTDTALGDFWSRPTTCFQLNRLLRLNTDCFTSLSLSNTTISYLCRFHTIFQTLLFGRPFFIFSFSLSYFRSR